MYQKVFLSFAHEDEPLARRIVEQLERAGMDVFYATENLRVGEGLSVIFDELFLRNIFVVLLTPHSKGSAWVAKELGLALSHQASGRPRLLIPIYRDLREPHHWLADVKAVQWVGDNDELLGDAVRLAMQGDSSQRDGGFGAFIATLVRVPREAYRTLNTLKSMAADTVAEEDTGRKVEDDPLLEAMAKVTNDTRQVALTMIQTAMENAGVALTDCKRVLHAVRILDMGSDLFIGGVPSTGYCLLAGESPAMARSQKPCSLDDRGWWKRCLLKPIDEVRKDNML